MLHFRQDRAPTAPRIARLPAARRQLLATDAGLLDVLDIGKAQGPAIVLVTHGLGSLESFEEIAEGLEARYPGRRIIAYSRPGRGASPFPANLQASQLLSHEAFKVLPALFAALGLATADLVAHSDGVAIALLFACSHPWLSGRIVAICPQVHADRETSQMAEDSIGPAPSTDDIARLGAEHFDPALATRCWHANRQALAADPDHVLRQVTALSAPLLLIQGLMDDQGGDWQMSELSARVKGPMNWVILRQDGHFPQLDNTEVVLDLICGHLDQTQRAGRKPALRSRAAS